MSEIILNITDVDPIDLYGQHNAKLNLLKEAFPEVTITSRGNNIKLTGEKKHTQTVKGKLETMVRLIKQKQELDKETIHAIISGANPFNAESGNGHIGSTILHGRNGKPIKEIGRAHV